MNNKEYSIIKWNDAVKSVPPIGQEVFFKTGLYLFYGVYGYKPGAIKLTMEVGYYDYLKKKKRKNVKFWGRLID